MECSAAYSSRLGTEKSVDRSLKTSWWPRLLALTQFGLNVQAFAFFPGVNDLQNVVMRGECFVKTNFFQFLVTESNQNEIDVSDLWLTRCSPIGFATKFR